MAQCSRCGRECTGTYCDTCQFYVYNDQCWRCRMYLPRVELQQWRGQVYCPYCIMDIREDEKNVEEAKGERSRAEEGGVPPDQQPPGVGQKNPDYECDKCKGDLDIAYIVADHKFCELCFQQQVRSWKDDNIQPPPYMKFRVKEGAGLFSRLLNFLKRKIREEWEKRSKGKGPNEEKK